MIYSNSFGQIFRITTLVSIFFLLSTAPRAMGDDATIHVLFMGNSLTTANNLPQLIADLAKSRNHIMEYDVYAPGGKTLAQHASDPVALSKIKKTGWDFVVLQEQSQAPSFSQGQVQQEVYPFASELSRFIKEANPGAHVVFYMTMAKKNGDQHNAAKVSPELGTYEGMQNRINQSYVNMAMNNNALVAPVGLVWKKVREQYPSIDLYADETHPNLTGTYLAACVFYAVFFNDTSAGLAHPSIIDGQTASAIQNVTDEVRKLPDLSKEIISREALSIPAESKSSTMDTETTSFPDSQSNDPLFRVGSEIICRNDIHPPKGEEEWMKQHKSYRNEIEVGWVHKKLRDSFCKHANCVPDEKYVAEWKIFMKDQLDGISARSQQRGERGLPETIDEEATARLESIMGGPPSQWQTNKALFEHYGGRIFKGNLGYYSPIEASLRLFQEMESKGELEFFDSKLYNRVIKDFETWMLSAVEPDEFQDELQKLSGMSSPWEYPFWSIESRLFYSTNHLPEEAVSFDADREKKNVQYFDKDGLLVLEEYVDGNNDLVRKKYNKNREILSSFKTTKKSGKEVTQVFNKDGLLTGERYFEGMTLFSKEYDKDGKVISEKKMDMQ